MEKVFLNSDIFKDKIPRYSGFESKIYQYDDELIKIFETNDINILYNKLNKIILLSELKSIDIIPQKLVFIDGIFKGYTFKDKLNYTPIDSLNEKRKEKIEILKKIKEKLEYYHDLGIIYGDLHQGNILYNGKDIAFCDLDNVYIDGYMFDKNNIYMERYLTFIPTLDEKLDNYSLNLLTLSYYQNISFPYVLTYLQTSHLLSYKFNTEKNKKILQDIINLNYKNFDELLIDNLKKTLIR